MTKYVKCPGNLNWMEAQIGSTLGPCPLRYSTNRGRSRKSALSKPAHIQIIFLAQASEQTHDTKESFVAANTVTMKVRIPLEWLEPFRPFGSTIRNLNTLNLLARTNAAILAERFHACEWLAEAHRNRR